MNFACDCKRNLKSFLSKARLYQKPNKKINNYTLSLGTLNTTYLHLKQYDKLNTN